MEDRYRDLISGIYEDKAAVPVEASITYQDGRKGTIKTDLKVRSAEGK
jgi:hypothetical protein